MAKPRLVGNSHPAVAKLDDASGFSSSGYGTDPHRSPIGLKASPGSAQLTIRRISGIKGHVEHASKINEQSAVRPLPKRNTPESSVYWLAVLFLGRFRGFFTGTGNGHC